MTSNTAGDTQTSQKPTEIIVSKEYGAQQMQNVHTSRANDFAIFLSLDNAEFLAESKVRTLFDISLVFAAGWGWFLLQITTKYLKKLCLFVQRSWLGCFKDARLVKLSSLQSITNMSLLPKPSDKTVGLLLRDGTLFFILLLILKYILRLKNAIAVIGVKKSKMEE